MYRNSQNIGTITHNVCLLMVLIVPCSKSCGGGGIFLIKKRQKHVICLKPVDGLIIVS